MRNIRVFTPKETSACSYLPDQSSRSMYIDPRIELDQNELSLLNLSGFRRSGRVVYRPDCPSCNSCIPVRILLQDFNHSRSHKRTIKRNTDLTLSIGKPANQDQLYPLYQRYIEQRHSDGDMYPPSFEQYQGFLQEDYGNTRFLTAHLDGQVLGGLIFDILDDGLSAVYCFFEPEQSRRSLAVYLILRLCQLAQALGLPYCYLGYYVPGCQKMEYKAKFSPLEQFINNDWRPYA